MRVIGAAVGLIDRLGKGLLDGGRLEPALSLSKGWECSPLPPDHLRHSTPQLRHSCESRNPRRRGGLGFPSPIPPDSILKKPLLFHVILRRLRDEESGGAGAFFLSPSPHTTPRRGVSRNALSLFLPSPSLVPEKAGTHFPSLFLSPSRPPFSRESGNPSPLSSSPLMGED